MEKVLKTLVAKVQSDYTYRLKQSSRVFCQKSIEFLVGLIKK